MALGPQSPVSPATDESAIQGLDRADRSLFFHKAEGSELIPMSWVRALKSIRTNRPFLEDPQRFGLIPDPEHPELPIGVTFEPARDLEFIGPMMGVNCAACHTGLITYQGSPPRLVLGAPNLFDLNAFYQELFASILVMMGDEQTQLEFMTTLAAQGDLDMAALTQQLAISAKAVGALSDRQLEGAASLFRLRVISAIEEVADGLGGGELFLAALGGEERAEIAKEVMDRVAEVIKGDILGLAATVLAGEPVSPPSQLTLNEEFVVPESLKAVAVDLILVRARLEYLKKLRILHEGERPIPGPGRIDAFGGIRDLVFSEEDAIPADAPVSFPCLWMVNQTYWFHWDGNTNSLIERNLGQALGQGAAFDLRTAHSSVRAESLHELEMVIRKITTPPWPTDLFGEIDEAKAGRGEQIYRDRCVACHAIVPPDGRNVLDAFEAVQAWHRTPESGRGGMQSPEEVMAALKPPEQIIPADRVGTDPARAYNVATNLGRTGPQYVGGRDFATELGVVAKSFAEMAYDDESIPDDVRAGFDWPADLVRWQTTRGYAARPLVGIWATAPYLHNGSVPTLDDLLLPAGERPKLFPVGHREYDPKKLGFVTDLDAIPESQRPQLFEMNATMSGNSNAGHEGPAFGTDLSDEDRAALLEYLKTL